MFNNFTHVPQWVKDITPNQGRVIKTVIGAGVGFGVATWAGLGTAGMIALPTIGAVIGYSGARKSLRATRSTLSPAVKKAPALFPIGKAAIGAGVGFAAAGWAGMGSVGTVALPLLVGYAGYRGVRNSTRAVWNNKLPIAIATIMASCAHGHFTSARYDHANPAPIFDKGLRVISAGAEDTSRLTTKIIRSVDSVLPRVDVPVAAASAASAASAAQRPQKRRDAASAATAAPKS